MAGLRFLDGELAELERHGWLRSLREASGAPGVALRIDGREVVNLASNNYLDLAAHPALREAAAEAARSSGTGATASRLICGSLTEHSALEAEVARFHGWGEALVFNSGYHANIGLLAALAGPEDAIVSDQLNHASLIDGCRLSRAEIRVYRHGDAGHAAEQLTAAASARRRFLVTESVFSMDGDRAPLQALRAAADRAGAALLIDEAHAVGALGPSGCGIAAELGVQPDALMGTFGKAFGGFGAYVLGPPSLRSWLVNRARSFVFTTALPPAVLAASHAALTIAAGAEGEVRRARLAARIERLAGGLALLGLLAPGAGRSPILPVLCSDERAAMDCTARLLERGLFVQGIRPPTVPRGTSRLRVALSAGHLPAHIDALLEALADLRTAGLVQPWRSTE